MAGSGQPGRFICVNDFIIKNDFFSTICFESVVSAVLAVEKLVYNWKEALECKIDPRAGS